MTSSNEDIIFCGALGPVMCRFSAAGDDHFTTRFGGRRRKTAKARSTKPGRNLAAQQASDLILAISLCCRSELEDPRQPHLAAVAEHAGRMCNLNLSGVQLGDSWTLTPLSLIQPEGEEREEESRQNRPQILQTQATHRDQRFFQQHRPTTDFDRSQILHYTSP